MKHFKKSFIVLAGLVFVGGFTASTLIHSQEKQQKSSQVLPISAHALTTGLVSYRKPDGLILSTGNLY